MSKQESVANILQKYELNCPESFKTYLPTILRIHRIHDYLHQGLDLVIEKYALQRADFAVLMTLRREGRPYCLSPTELYCSMLFSSGGLTKVLTRVTEAGLVTRIANPEDKRSKLVKLTETGKQLIDKLRHELDICEQKKMSVLAESEQQQLNTLLEKLLSAWE